MNPSDLGLPKKFTAWRHGQATAISDITSCSNKHMALVMPTGVGKSLIYMAGALQLSGKVVILTSTKGLQDQLMRDFAEIGLVEIRGRRNYRCVRGDGPSADDGLCRFGMECAAMEFGCPYYDALREARRSRFVVTNYAYWLSADPFHAETIVMDEGHAAPDHLADFLTVIIDTEKLSQYLGVEIHVPKKSWGSWLDTYEPVVDKLIAEGLKNPDLNLRRLRHLSVAKRTMEGLSRILGVEYVVEQIDKHKYKVDPVVIKKFTGQYLFRGSDLAVLTSATITKHTLEMLGVPKGSSKFREYPSPFPLSNRPVTFVPTVNVDRFIDKGDEAVWLGRINQIIKQRLDRKGIVHTVSYDRARKIKEASELSGYFHLHDSTNTAHVVRDFKRDRPPAILLSPSMTTGYDFPDKECEFQVIAKVPFPDSRSLIHKARAELDRELPFHMAWQEIVQACGRGVRAENDRCDTIIVDNHFQWLYSKYKHLAPTWFVDSVRTNRLLPQPLDKL